MSAVMTEGFVNKRRAEYEERRKLRGEVDHYRHLSKGDTVKVSGERGLFKVEAMKVVDDACEWVLVSHDGCGMRFFTFDRITKKRKAVAR